MISSAFLDHQVRGVVVRSCSPRTTSLRVSVTQWAAVRTCREEMRTPAQRQAGSEYLRSAIQGQSSDEVSSPPDIRRLKDKRLPQTAVSTYSFTIGEFSPPVKTSSTTTLPNLQITQIQILLVQNSQLLHREDFIGPSIDMR